MNVDLAEISFSFMYDKQSSREWLTGAQRQEQSLDLPEERQHSTVWTLTDGLRIRREVRRFPAFGAFEQVLWWHNTGDAPSGLISELNDFDAVFPFELDEAPVKKGFLPAPTTARIISTTGSNWVRDEFFPKPQFILPGQSHRYAPTGGRSSQGTAPFFDLNRGDAGVLLAVGWTGQWQAVFSRDEKDIRVRSGIDDVGFRLLPGEQIRTSSIVVLPYTGGQTAAHNQFRRLVREHFSLIGQPGLPEHAPFAAMAWGSLPSDEMVRRIERLRSEQFGFEYYWIDAGWYGNSQQNNRSEFEGDWGIQTGNWQVNPIVHPDGLQDVAQAVRDNGLKLLLWVEPERVIHSNPLPQEHPEWFLKDPESQAKHQNWLLNLGDEAALAATIELISNLVESLGLGCYRQDFNIDPLPFWRREDAPERRGITEIKHIMGLYRFWDALLERHPGLIIDNCSSGGRRIDIETVRRSVPLWRSDYQCNWNSDPETAQVHNTGIAWWLPYSGTGTGSILGDTYRFRSCYSAGMVVSAWGYEDWPFRDDQPHDWMRRIGAEYLRVRPYFSCDYYPLVPPAVDDSNWAAWQFDRPEQGDGVILAFRRPDSPLEKARFALGGLVDGTVVRFEDADSGEVFTVGADVLAREGLALSITERRQSRLLFYQVVQC